MSTEPLPDWTSLIAERKIKEAIDAGEFDNLPGKGKPLNLDENPMETIMERILKRSGALPEWAELAREIQKDVDALAPSKERGLRAIRLARNEPSRVHAAERLRNDYKERMSTVNKMILKYTYTCPASVQRPFRTFRIKEEMEQLEQDIQATLMGG